MLARNRKLTVLVAASYLLVVCATSLFHHHEEHDEGSFGPGFAASHSESGEDCSICQFLAQNPAPVTYVVPVESGELVQKVLQLEASRFDFDLFSAWQSRAPPCFA